MKKLVNLLCVTVGLGTFYSLDANAALQSYSANGVDLVYSSVSNVTWSKDANLLGSMIASSGDANLNTVKDVIDNIINLTPSILVSPDTNGYYFLSVNDFANDGTTTWYGANAFVNYLNNIQYAGRSSWYLPTEIYFDADGYSTQNNGTAKGEELVELYYAESVVPGDNTNPGNQFVNTPQENVDYSSSGYWMGTEDEGNTDSAWNLSLPDGYQGVSDKTGNYFYVRAATTGLIGAVTPVDEPNTSGLFLFGLLALMGLSYRKHTMR
jgi:hypothetical protein